MAAREASKIASKSVKPLLSSNKSEAKKRVLNLYKAYYRQIPLMLFDHNIPVTKEECQKKLKEEFLKNKHVTDVRVIDMLVIKGQMLLQEIVTKWAQECHIMSLFKDSVEPKPNDFLSKFVNNNDSQ
ncbi:NADH dehydrogenase [ubiquinone] 1 alpha subcomplex subunit 6 [Daktulosphaira vitifoliae]|uniref:NADH dehydrogenase [ubiquinone] 1 alpha subcomplex subunit 6 n=1 Tax=Daktulosphaira vitifoliae TaxID=58002 RepID=UPI0021A9AB00|nr:NADH dehydrogenase [ubiquinone] 1 alpha subcomplex subunit 6 [Daktulosphaira vitifoliae]